MLEVVCVAVFRSRELLCIAVMTDDTPAIKSCNHFRVSGDRWQNWFFLHPLLLLCIKNGEARQATDCEKCGYQHLVSGEQLLRSQRKHVLLVDASVLHSGAVL